jgi:arylsulfatase A-like enzyme
VNRWRISAAAVVAVVLVVVALRLGRSPARVPLHDLADRLWLAERDSPREFVWFGTPSAARHVVQGLYWELDGSGWAWAVASPTPELVFDWQDVAPRAALIDLEPSPGNTEQGLAIRLNGAPVAALDLSPRRARYQMTFPAEAQRSGENRVQLVFAHSAPLAPGDVREYAARLFSLSVARADDAGLTDLLGREAPPLFGVSRGDGGPTLSVVGPARVSFALPLPERAALAFTPELHPVTRGVGQAVDFRVVIGAEGGEERAIWQRKVRPEDAPQEVILPLEGRAGGVVRVSLEVAGKSGERYRWAVWRAPRVLGVRRVGDLLPAPPDRGRARRGESLRRGLSEASVLLVILDAARAQNFGCYGYRRPTTPEIDRIAADGVVFERAYTTGVNTLAGMSSLWTSQYPDAHHRGHLFLEPLPADRPTLAELLGARGVTTFGAVANAMAGQFMRLDRGFATFREIYDDKRYGSRAEVFRKRAYDWFEGMTGQRFFAYLHFREPHYPFDPPDRYLEMFGPNAPLSEEQRMSDRWTKAVNDGAVRPTEAEVDHLIRVYDGNLAYADHEVGALRAHLERLGLWEQMVVIVTADHGDQLYEEDYIGHSAQVREESARIPLIVHFPERLGLGGKHVAGLVDLTDLAPTIEEIFGATEITAGFQGRSLLPVIEGAPGKAAVLVRTVWERPVYALVGPELKLVRNTRTGRERLFDLAADPGERRDIAAARPLLAEFYRQSLCAWVGRLTAMPIVPVDGAGPKADGCQGMTREQCLNLCKLGYIDCDGCSSCR